MFFDSIRFDPIPFDSIQFNIYKIMTLTNYRRAAVLLFLAESSLTLPLHVSAFVSPTSSSITTTKTTTTTAVATASTAGTGPATTSSSRSALGASFFESLFEDENEKLFERFDADRSGAIDKEEFKDVVRKINGDSRRREILSVATATFGGIWVASASQTFQFGQKKLRDKYLEPLAERAMFEQFPTAVLSGDCDAAVWKTLRARGFTPANTLLGHSVCSDEINNRKEQLVPLMVDRWGEGFALGGLGGLPFAGKSGFGAYLHHVPDDGKLLVVFAPHVGVDGEGRIGGLQRDGQAKVSSACGAAIGAYKALQSKKSTPQDPLTILDNVQKEDYQTKFDPQLEQIVNLLAPRLKGIEDASDSIAFVTYQMQGIIRELITACITQTPDLFENASEVAVVGGIIINRRKGGDFFQPLSFETRKRVPEGGSTNVQLDDPIDLFEETFGPKPNLLPVMGSAAALERIGVSCPLGTLGRAQQSN